MRIGVGDEARLYSPRLRLDTGDRYRLFRKTTRWAADQKKQVSGEFANKRDRLGKLLTRATRDLSVTTNTPQGFKNTTQYGGNAENFTAETGGSTFRSAEMSFYIDDDAFILDAQLRFVVTGYRTYERDISAAGSTTSGASSRSSSEESDSDSHAHFLAAYSGDGGAATVRKFDMHNPSGTSIYVESDSSNSLATGVEMVKHVHGIAHTHSLAGHSHAQNYDIFEDTTAPGQITVKLDSVNINAFINGPFSVSLGSVVDVSLAGLLVNPGWHTLRFEAASGKGRVTPYVLVKSLQLQPGV